MSDTITFTREEVERVRDALRLARDHITSAVDASILHDDSLDVCFIICTQLEILNKKLGDQTTNVAQY